MITNQKLYAGINWKWTESFNDYPASQYDSDLIIKKGTDDAKTFKTEKDGDSFIRSLSKGTTTNLPSGRYQFQYVFTYISDGSTDVPKGFEGSIEINAILSSATYDTRTHNLKMLEALQATLEGRASMEFLNLSYKGRSLQLLTMQELRDAINYYQDEIEKDNRQEQMDAGEITGGKLLIGFGNGIIR